MDRVVDSVVGLVPLRRNTELLMIHGSTTTFSKHPHLAKEKVHFRKDNAWVQTGEN